MVLGLKIVNLLVQVEQCCQTLRLNTVCIELNGRTCRERLGLGRIPASLELFMFNGASLAHLGLETHQYVSWTSLEGCSAASRSQSRIYLNVRLCAK